MCFSILLLLLALQVFLLKYFSHAVMSGEPLTLAYGWKLQYDRFSETAVGSSGITKGSLRSCQRPRVRFAGGIDRTAEKMDLPSVVVAGLQGLLGFVEAKSGMVDDVDDGDAKKLEGRTAGVLGFWGGTGRDVTMCDEECGWCGECGDEYRP